MKIAFVYDRINKFGGAERVLLALHEIWPEAPIYTSVYDIKKAKWAEVFKVIPSFLQSFPLAKRNHEFYPTLMPYCFENFCFDDFEVVISITSEAAKGIITKPGTMHLCYCLTPTRYLWSGYGDYFDSRLLRFLSRTEVKNLQFWDKIASQRPDAFLAISCAVRERIKKYYCRKSEVIYPPVELDKFKIKKMQDKTGYEYFLVVSRLVKYKHVDLAVRVFNELGWNLKIVGTGREISKLKSLARQNIEFLGQLTDEELLVYYQNCQAVIFPQDEDFGIVPLEAQACGKPVIAFCSGGAKETVAEGKTGLFFKEQTVSSLKETLLKFDASLFKGEDCRHQSEKFGKEKFKKEFKQFVEEEWQKYKMNTFMH